MCRDVSRCRRGGECLGCFQAGVFQTRTWVWAWALMRTTCEGEGRGREVGERGDGRGRGMREWGGGEGVRGRWCASPLARSPSPAIPSQRWGATTLSRRLTKHDGGGGETGLGLGRSAGSMKYIVSCYGAVGGRLVAWVGAGEGEGAVWAQGREEGRYERTGRCGREGSGAAAGARRALSLPAPSPSLVLAAPRSVPRPPTNATATANGAIRPRRSVKCHALPCQRPRGAA